MPASLPCVDDRKAASVHPYDFHVAGKGAYIIIYSGYARELSFISGIPIIFTLRGILFLFEYSLQD
jgi:hypothetical protein